MVYVDYNVKGTSQNPATWHNFLQICDARWWWKLRSKFAKGWLLVVRGFWDMCIVWMKSVTDETQHISKFVLSQVVVDMVGPGFEMHCPLSTTQKPWQNGSLRYVARWQHVKGTSQNPGYVHVYWLPAWGCTSRGCLLMVNAWHTGGGEQRAVVGKKTAHLLPFSPDWTKSYSSWTSASAKWWRTGSLPPSRMMSAGGHARACPPRVNKMMMFAKIFYPEEWLIKLFLDHYSSLSSHA